jgi:hypothetical protein
VHSVEIDLDPDVFIARREGQRLVAQHRRVVRGIALKTTNLQLDHWIQKLSTALARHAANNARAAWVLSRIGGSRSE